MGSRILTSQKQARELGRLRTGYSVPNQDPKKRPRPVKSKTWVVSSHAEHYVKAAAAAMGGNVERWQPQGNGAPRRSEQSRNFRQLVTVDVSESQDVDRVWFELGQRGIELLMREPVARTSRIGCGECVHVVDEGATAAPPQDIQRQVHGRLVKVSPWVPLQLRRVFPAQQPEEYRLDDVLRVFRTCRDHPRGAVDHRGVLAEDCFEILWGLPYARSHGDPHLLSGG